MVYWRLSDGRDDRGLAELDAQLNRPIEGMTLTAAQDARRVADERALFAQTLARFG